MEDHLTTVEEAATATEVTEEEMETTTKVEILEETAVETQRFQEETVVGETIRATQEAAAEMTIPREMTMMIPTMTTMELMIHSPTIEIERGRSRFKVCRPRPFSTST